MQCYVVFLTLKVRMIEFGTWGDLEACFFGHTPSLLGRIALFLAETFHPPRIPQQQWNGNKTGWKWVTVADPLKSDVAPIVDPFFKPFLAIATCFYPLPLLMPQ